MLAKCISDLGMESVANVLTVMPSYQEPAAGTIDITSPIEREDWLLRDKRGIGSINTVSTKPEKARASS